MGQSDSVFASLVLGAEVDYIDLEKEDDKVRHEWRALLKGSEEDAALAEAIQTGIEINNDDDHLTACLLGENARLAAILLPETWELLSSTAPPKKNECSHRHPASAHCCHRNTILRSREMSIPPFRIDLKDPARRRRCKFLQKKYRLHLLDCSPGLYQGAFTLRGS